MSRILIIGGGAAGMMASVFAARNGHKVHIFSTALRKMKKQEKSATLPARDGATSPMPARWIRCSQACVPMKSFSTARFTALQIRMR